MSFSSGRRRPPLSRSRPHHALQVPDLVLRLVQKLILVALLLQQQQRFTVEVELESGYTESNLHITHPTI